MSPGAGDGPRGDRAKSTAWQTWGQPSILALLLAVLYSRIIANLVVEWWTDPNYSHGFIIPIFCAWIVWKKRKELAAEACRETWLAGHHYNCRRAGYSGAWSARCGAISFKNVVHIASRRSGDPLQGRELLPPDRFSLGPPFPGSSASGDYLQSDCASLAVRGIEACEWVADSVWSAGFAQKET